MITYQIFTWTFVVLGVIALIIEVRALVDALRRPSRSYLTAEKRTKGFWVAMCAVGVFFGYLAIPRISLFGFGFGLGLPWLFMLLAVLPGAIYLADVKPEVKRYSGGSSRGGW